MSGTLDQHRTEVLRGDRFEFGRNWARFLRTLNDERIALAENSLRDMLGVTRLDGKAFLDVGSGSGLFSLAARRLGAKVHSFDFDPESVACTAALRKRYFQDAADWVVERGSVLDKEYLGRLGAFDVVYSWGVLHHTGAMWQAFENVKALVRQSGKLFIAIYNDQGEVTDHWADVKRKYNALPRFLALPYALTIILRCEWPQIREALVRRRLHAWIDQWRSYPDKSTRGMSRWFDWIDWIGGYPYERATIEQVVDAFARDGFKLFNLFDCSGGYGCNEFVFAREAAMGTWVESRIPGGTSFVRRYCTRVHGPFERLPSGYFGTAVAQTQPAKPSYLLLRNGKLAGAVDYESGTKIKVAPLSDPPRDDEVFQIAAGLSIDPTEVFRYERGKMWSWDIPDLEPLADNTRQPANSSPVFVFEDGVQQPYPHALHDDIAKHGKGRFSHWGRQVLFSPLAGEDPNATRNRFKLVVALEDVEPAAITRLD